ncbi:MAG: tRNA uridine-5-carboxymethylaminomethyl(34) synthesis GTPase MnmE [Lachnospiraceae bacterium]|nr:tRNA uridine-5-carboxymethylaminomethyl(34) synthesis GTPase MnmE [Ruminococcus sp.]MCM1274872.1 tRNA uridine-5-carboxymethylaminomethyl(34) synthesis GTPase MnmE [Lachnospiraceae bacterium]
MVGSTVCAIATPAAVGGISVVRISGENAFAVAERIFKPVSGKPVAEMRGYTAAYGKIYDGGERLDDGVLLAFRAPRSYTGEDVCEISCHGGIYVTRRVLTACLKAGAEPAAAGEFTKRALLNGKLSLTQAEAVADMVLAQGEQMLVCSNSQREGALYRRCEKIADMLLEILSQISAWIDYPDDDTPVVTNAWLAEKISAAEAELDDLRAGYDNGRMLREGISCAIVGKPNAGKSTLMNLLSGSRRSIVSGVAGTTRDVVEETVNLGGAVLLLSDCAGIRETDDEVEKIGVEIMLEKLQSADIVLAVFDGSRELSDEDRRLFGLLKNKKVLAIVNKSDLEQMLDVSELESRFGKPLIISAKDEGSVGVIGNAITERLELGNFTADAGFIANERQRACLLRADGELFEADAAAKLGVTPDAIGVSLERALDAIYELSGKKASEEVIAEVFKRFCVGK